MGLVVLAIASAACGPGLRDFLFGPNPVSDQPTAQSSPEPVPVVVAPAPPVPRPSAQPPVGEDPPPNTNPVVRVGAKVFFVECGGLQVPDSEYATEAPVGCRLHLDCTPRDANDRPTEAQGFPHWYLSDPTLVSGGSRSDYTPTFTIVEEGDLTLEVQIDGVMSNEVVVRFHR